MKAYIKKRVGKRNTVWYGRVDLPPDPATGKRRQKRFTAPTKKEAENIAAGLIASIAHGGFAEAEAGKLTLAQYIERWIPVNARSVRPLTHRRYADLLRLHLVPKIGGIQLAKLTPLDVQRLYANRMDEGKLSPTTVQQLHNILHKALKQAVKWGLLVKNVTDSVEPPRKTTPEYVTWSQQQAMSFLAVAEQDDFAALWRLALMTGMRRGELLGLTWEAVDLNRGVLSVTKTITRAADGGKWQWSEPKTKAGRRSIALPRSVVDALRRHRIKQATERLQFASIYHDHDLVFATQDGTPLHPNSLALRFNRLIAQAGVPRLRFHDLRHTSATLMLANGEHPKIVQERLGHSDIGMTLNRYSHVTMQMQREAAERLERLMDASS